MKATWALIAVAAGALWLGTAGIASAHEDGFSGSGYGRGDRYQVVPVRWRDRDDRYDRNDSRSWRDRDDRYSRSNSRSWRDQDDRRDRYYSRDRRDRERNDRFDRARARDRWDRQRDRRRD